MDLGSRTRLRDHEWMSVTTQGRDLGSPRGGGGVHQTGAEKKPGPQGGVSPVRVLKLTGIQVVVF